MKKKRFYSLVFCILMSFCFSSVSIASADVTKEQKIEEARAAIYAFDYVNSTNSQIETFYNKYGDYIGEAVGWANIPSIWGPGYQERADRYWDYLQGKKAIADANYLWQQNTPSLSDVNSNHGFVSNQVAKSSRVYYADGYYGGFPSGKDYDTILDLRDTTNAESTVEKDGLFDMIIELFAKVIFFLAEGVDILLTRGGMGLDNIIFGRVGGYGTKICDGSTNPVVSFFSFELTTGNPYGVVAAMLYQKVRGAMYVLMVLYCAIRLIKLGAKNDYERLLMDRRDFLENAFLSFSMVVFMPYFLDLFLFVKDILLKGIAIATLEDLFGASGFLEAFRDNAASYELIPCILYLGAVCASLIFAAIYVAYAMSMTIHFVLFPAVCVKAIGNKNALTEWVGETVGLTIMPIVDGMLLMIPLTFSTLGKGVMVMQLLSLIACAMLLVARKQARRTLGIRDNNMLEMGALASVMGAAQLVKGVSNGVRRSAGRFVAGRKASDADYEMSDYYGALADAESSGGEAGAGEQSISAPVGLSANMPTYQEAVGAMVSNAAAERFANVDNFENPVFQGQLSNKRLSELYKQRAKKNMRKAEYGSLGAFAGGVVGGTVGFGAGLFMGSGMQSFLTGTGVDVGSNLGGMAGDYIANMSFPKTMQSVQMAGNQMAGNVAGQSVTANTELMRSEVERMSGAVEGETQEIVIRNEQSHVATPQRSKEQMQQEYEVYQTHQFLFKENGGKNGADYANIVSEAGNFAEAQVAYKFKETDAAPITDALNTARERYSAGEMSSDAYRNQVANIEEKINRYKERVLKNAVMDQLNNRTDVTFDKNNEIHRKAMSLTYMSSQKTFSEPHRLFSDEYTKERLGIDLSKYRV